MSVKSASTATKDIPVPRYAWVILVIVYLTGLVPPMTKMKIPPVMPILIEAFQLNYTQAGWLMSIFSVTGVLLAFPAGLIMRKIGAKATGLIAISSSLIGAVLGATAKTAGLLLFSRFVEGIGFGLFVVVGPAALATWFPRERRGMVMGIWSTFAPVGYLIVLNLTPMIESSLDWQAIWWVGAGLSLLFIVLFWLLFRMPRPEEIHQDGLQTGDFDLENIGLRECLLNRDIWLLGFAFMCFSFVQMSFSTFYPTYLNTELGYSLASASFLVSIQMIVITAPFIGWISDKIGSRKIVLVAGLVAMALLMISPFVIVGYGAIMTYFIIRGVFEDSTSAMCYAAAPEVVSKPEFLGIAMAMLGLGQGLGNVFGPPVFGWLVEATNSWAVAGYWMIPVVLVGAITSWFIKVR